MDKTKLIRYGLILFSVALLLLTAWNSDGYYQADEHFQIVELANFKLDNITEKQLTWEYEAQIRPGLQPFLFFSINQAGEFIGLDAFQIIRISRIVTFMFFLLLTFIIYKRFGLDSLWFLLIWFIPTLFCRFSAEIFGSIFLGFALLISRTHLRNWILIGLCLGFAFIIRFQIGISIVALILFWFSTKKLRGKEILMLSIGGLIALLLLFISDHWLYSEWVFTPWNYLKINIIENTDKYGTSPFFSYFSWALEKSLALPALLLFTTLIWFTVKFKSHELTWVVWSFIMAHLFIGHKELRFLFPMLIPMWLMMLHLFHTHPIFRKWAIISILVLFPVTIYRAFAPLKSEVAALKIAYQLGEPICYSKNDPLDPFGAPFYYYKNLGIQSKKVDAFDDCNLWYGDRRKRPENAEILYQDIPETVIEMTDIGNWSKRSTINGVYYLSPHNGSTQ